MGAFVYRFAAWIIAAVMLLCVIAYCIGVHYSSVQAEAFKAAELLVWGAGLFSVLLIRKQLWEQEQQAGDTFRQLVEDHKWRTYAFYHEHFKSVPDEPTRGTVYKIAEDLNFVDHFNDRGRPVPTTALSAINADPEKWKFVRSYLDAFEEFCGAVNAKLVDEDYAYSLQATRVIRNYTVFQQLILQYQQGAPTAYVELSKVAIRWGMRMNVNEASAVASIGIGGNGASPLNGPQRGLQPG